MKCPVLLTKVVPPVIMGVVADVLPLPEPDQPLSPSSLVADSTCTW